MTGPLLLEGRDLSVTYRRSAGLLSPPTFLTALDTVAFTLAEGESLAVVGESGSGKSTLARAVLRLVPLAAGQVLLRGEDLAGIQAGRRGAGHRGRSAIRPARRSG